VICVIALPPTAEETIVRQRIRLLPVLAAAGLVLAACADGADDPVGTTDDLQTDVTEPVGDTEDGLGEDDLGEDPATEETEETEADDAATQDDAATGAATASGLDVATSDLGEHLVDDAGNTVYVNVVDAECGSECARVWPVVSVDGEPTTSDGVDGSLVGTTERPDGTTQLTYADQPLHTFVGDDPGQAGGQGVAGSWFVVAPDGEAIGADAAASDGDTAADE
jgi:predicted lipoprotein with Yx(FWY)xxD motif